MTLFTRMVSRAGKSSQLSAASRIAVARRHLSTTPAAMAEDTVLYESAGSTRLYKLNRPKALNALDHDMVKSLAAEANTWRESDLCKLIIGRGDERAFCAGGDVKGLVESRPTQGSKLALSFFKDEFELNWEMGRFGKPYVAIIDGFTMGGGAGISLPAGIRIATKKTVFAMPETKIGYAPDVGGNYYIAQLDGEIGAWLAVTGQEVWGRAVYELGIATHYVDPASIPELVTQLSALEDPSLQSVSALVSNYHVGPAPEGTAPSSRDSREGPSPVTGAVRAFLDKTFGLPSIKEIYHALEKGAADESAPAEVRDWAAAQKKQMDARSPTGMAVALANYKLAKGAKRLNTALENDLLMAVGFVGNDRATEDFETGVTHVLITKGKGRADWKPSSIDDEFVSPASIRKHFLDPKTPHLAQELPTLNFNPKPSTAEGPDSTWGQFRRFGLPSEQEVAAVIKGEDPSAGAFKLTEPELVDRIVDARGEAGSPRQAEVVDKVKAIVGAHTKKDGEGYLDWVN